MKKKRKHDWCFFSDGHREKIIDWCHPYSSREDIIFYTRSGQYKYKTPEYVPSMTIKAAAGLLRMKDYEQIVYFFKRTVIRDGHKLVEDYVPCYNINRIELRSVIV